MTLLTAQRDDLAELLQLYTHLAPDNPPYPTTTAEQIFDRFLAYEGSAILLARLGEILVASCTLVVVPNLTRGGLPYGLIENVVTHKQHRGCGFGTAVLQAACEHAWALDCYKVMLMTGTRDPATLAFYARAGFERSKTGYQKRRVGNTG